MTSTPLPATPGRTENVGQGALFALATIPVAIVIAALVGGLFGIIAGIVAIFIPAVAVWLYERGAGAPLSRRGWLPVVLISIASILLSILGGFVGSAFKLYTSVGNRDPFGPAFWTTVRLQMTNSDAIFPILLGLGLGGAALFGLLRRPRPAAQKADAEAAAAQMQVNPTPAAAPQQPGAQLNPSPGVQLNPGPSVSPQQPGKQPPTAS